MSIKEATLESNAAQQLYENTLETIEFPRINQRQLAWQDIRDGLKHWRIWTMLAYQDIKLRYRRSILGPFWITISMAITVYTMGYLYSHLFHISLGEYFPYLVGGMLAWSLIATTVPDLVDAFITYEAMIKQIKLPYSLYVHRVTMRNFLIFFHNMLVIIPIMIIFHDQMKFGLELLFLIPGLAILYLNCISYGLFFAMIGGRYRDISQIIKSLVQIVFFITPVMWKPEVLPADKQYIALYNPVYSFIELIRAPLVGHLPTLTNLVMVGITTTIGLMISYFIFASRRARIIYWL